MDSQLSALSSQLRRRGGFALLITITLLAFLVILLVGLATYTRVETAIAGNTQRQAQARQNALLALNVAVGQLQKYAGPDQRVTATAESFGGVTGTKYFTGVWNNNDPAAAPIWLVSGSESGAINVKAAPAAAQRAELVGVKTSGVASDVVAALQDIKTVGVPGVNGSVTMGRYAWWIGDQGVKAPVAVADNTAAVNYAPWDSAELRSRLRQQVPLGAGPADASGNAVFEPRDAVNSLLVANQKITAFNQIAFLKTSAGGTALGLTLLQKYFHAWSPNNFNVLVNTRLGGLRQDLSLDATLLGPSFAGWVNYAAYMENPADSATSALPPIPVFSSDPIRRRYILQPVTSSYAIAPVLSFFGLSFSLHNDTQTNSPAKLQASARFVVGLWNPYSAALVPEDLEMTVSGLPTVLVESPGAPPRLVNLQSVFVTSGGSVKFALPFTSNGQDPDRSSWLPGRVYNWSATSSTDDPGLAGYPTQFYLRDATPSGSRSGLLRDAGAPIGPNTIIAVQQVRTVSAAADHTLVITLRRVSDGATLGTFTSPTFQMFTTAGSNRTPGGASSDFAYVFRLPDSTEIPNGESELWLQSAGRDVREPAFPASGHSGFVVVSGQQPNPVLLVTAGQAGFPTEYPDLLLDRYPNAVDKNYNEDVPVFELPRAPLLSVGSLQHLRIDGVRPFSVGNSWTGGAQLNGIKIDELFDRFFFSGLVASVAPATVNGSLLLPNPLLKVLRDPMTSAPVALAGLQGAPTAQSSKFLLQGGAFNLNSVNKTAWIAVLRTVRFPTGVEFTYLNAIEASGTADDATATLTEPFLTNSQAAAFPRFGQSAQEVFKTDSTYQQSQSSFTTTAAPVIDTPLFRRGIRMLSSSDVATLADQIVTLIQQKHAASGPFRHLEEFLNSSSLVVGASGQPVSLLEKAIERANLNDVSKFDTPGVEFSSQWLTQGDIMTALAPVLFPRSDTFVIRSYGEAVNPATTATEGRAWCEAVVQRVPEYFDKTQPEETAPADLNADNLANGRRFKIISFRWLTRSDI